MRVGLSAAAVLWTAAASACSGGALSGSRAQDSTSAVSSSSASPSGPAALANAHIVTTERGPRGGRLVLLDEDGTRLADLTPIEARTTLDVKPSWSPDGHWVAFASNRGRTGSPAQTSLWLARAGKQGPLHRLTEQRSVDLDPRWSPDGRALVYASTRGVSLDLWVLPLKLDRAGVPVPAGPPRQLTHTDDLDEIAPSVSPDGRQVIYMAMDRKSQRSSLWRVPFAGGTATRLTAGPADLTPAISPDGGTIAFAAPVKGKSDIDLWLAEADGTHRRPILRDDIGDETGPVWSADGRYLFATSVVRDPRDGTPLLSTVVFIDLRERPPVLRALRDPAAIEQRVGAALSPATLDSTRLHRDPTYADAVQEAIDTERRLQRQEQPRGR